MISRNSRADERSDDKHVNIPALTYGGVGVFATMLCYLMVMLPFGDYRLSMAIAAISFGAALGCIVMTVECIRRPL